MNIWCFAALSLGGGDPPPVLQFPSSTEPALEAKPVQGPIVRAESPCTDCGGKVLPRPPVARQALPSLSPPTQAQRLTTVVQSSGPVPVDLPRTRSDQPNIVQAPMYDAAVQYPQPGQYAAAQPPQRSPWWKRLFYSPKSESQSVATIQSAPATTVATMPPAAGRGFQRETWRTKDAVVVTQETTPAVSAPKAAPMPRLAAAAPTPPSTSEAPQTAASGIHTVRKPVTASPSMIRDASAWQYSASQLNASKAEKTTGSPTAPKDWPKTVELPSPTQESPKPVSTSTSWTDDVIAKTLDHNVGARKATATAAIAEPKTIQEVVVPVSKADGEIISGCVSWTHAAGGCWVLKTDAGSSYLLKGDDSILRLRVGDRIEVKGAVKPSDVLGMNSVNVEKVSLTAKR